MKRKIWTAFPMAAARGVLAIAVVMTVLMGAALCGCAVQPNGLEDALAQTPPAATLSVTAENTGETPPAAATPSATADETGELAPIVVPTMPPTVPGYLEVDPDTGLHMTGTPTVVDFDTYRLKVSGKVDFELSLTYDDVRRLPKITATPDLVCEGVFVDKATWSGASLKTILDMARVQPDATRIALMSADGYLTSMSLEDAIAEENFLAYELDGQTLPVLHGFPLRAVIPGLNGNHWAKWLEEIVVE